MFARDKGTRPRVVVQTLTRAAHPADNNTANSTTMPYDPVPHLDRTLDFSVACRKPSDGFGEQWSTTQVPNEFPV